MSKVKDAEYERVRMTYESAEVTIDIDEVSNIAWIRDLYSYTRRKGHARKLMEDVIDGARKKNMVLLLRVQSGGKQGDPTDEQLVQFYRSLGFKMLKAHLPDEQRMIWQIRSTDEDE